MIEKSFGFQKYSRIFAVIMVLMLADGSIGVAHAASTYKFGVFPFMPLTALLKYYNGISIDFTKAVKKRVIAQSRPTFKKFSEEIEKESYDIILVQPFDYPTAYEHNYVPLARRKDNLDAIFVTKIGGDINSIQELKGKKLANPPVESAITNVIKKELSKNHLNADNIQMIYTNNHFACMQMVLVGRADACSTTTPVLEHWENTRLKQKKLRIVHQADAIPNTLYMAHKRVPVEDREKIKRAILTWSQRPEGNMILKTFSLSGFVEAKDAEYNVIRNYWNQEK